MSSNEIQVATLTSEEISAILAAAGAVDEEQEQFHRIKVDGQSFVANDDNIWFSNPKTKEPAFTARIMGPPSQFQSFWFTQEDAITANRPEMANSFCKSSYDNPQENRVRGTNGASCRDCQFNPFSDRRPKCSWKGDLQFQIVPDDGMLTGEEVVYTLTLSTTGMIQWRGTRVNPKGGSVPNTDNTMHALAKLALSLAPEWGMEPEQAIVAALTALNNGMVAAEFRIFRNTNENNGQTWSIPVITPVHIETGLVDDKQMLESGEDD